MSRLSSYLKGSVELVGNLAFLAMFGAFLLQVFTRYVLNAPLGWTTEASLIFFLWFAFWGAGLMAADKDHVRFDLLYKMAPPKVRRAMALVATLTLGILFAVALPANVDFIIFMAQDVTWVLEIRFDYVFSVFAVFMTAVVLRSLWRAWRLAGRDWPDHL